MRYQRIGSLPLGYKSTLPLLGALFAFATAHADQSISLKLAKVQSKAQVDNIESILQEIAQPVEVERHGKDIEALLSEHCGGARPTILEAAKKLNESAGSNVVLARLPPCSYWKEKARVAVPLGSSVERVAKRYTGELNLSKVLVRPGFDNPDSVKAGQQIVLKGVSMEQRLVLANGVSFPQAASALLAGTAMVCNSEGECSSKVGTDSPKGARAILDEENNEAEPVTFVDDLPLPDRPSCENVSTEWPVPSAFTAELNGMKQFASTGSSAIIGVVDSGVPETMVPSLPILEMQGTEDSAAKTIGLALAMIRNSGAQPFSPDVAAYPQADHGMIVASASAGYPVFGAGMTPPSWVALRIYSIMARHVTGPAWADSGAIRTAVSRAPGDIATTGRTPILNVSWTYKQKDMEFEGALKQTTSLVVVAAGNSSQDLDVSASFPASYAHDYTNLISVAALRPDMKLASFSATGREHVTLAAPGCSVPVIDGTGVEKRVSGTSIAAPLVAFTAAVIHSLGINEAWKIKVRLQAAADVDDSLRVEGGRRLNMLDSIAVRDDIVHLKDGRRLRGELEPGIKFKNADTGATLRLANIVRIHDVHMSAGEVRVKGMWISVGDSSMTSGTVLASGQLLMKGSAEPMTWSDIESIVPRMIGDKR